MFSDEAEQSAKIDGMESDVDDRCARLEGTVDRQLAELQAAAAERDELVGSMRKQLKGNDDALGKSVDMLQVRYESAAAEIERLTGNLREVRAEVQEQCGACATACERTSASSGAALEKIQRTLASNRDELEAWVADELDSGLKSVAEKEAVRFQALCRSVDERMLAAQQEIQALGQVRFLSKNLDFLLKNPDFLLKNPDFRLKSVDFTIIQSHVSSLAGLESSVREEIASAVDRSEGRCSALAGEIRRSAESGEASRQQLAEEMNGYHASDAARSSELERRMIETEVTTEQTLARRVAEAGVAHKVNIERVEERVLSDLGGCEQRMNGRLDDCFTQLNSSLEMYKHMRTLCKDTASSTKQTEDLVARQFTAMEGSIETRFEEKFSRLSVAEQAMAAAAAGKGVLKFSPNKPEGRGPAAAAGEVEVLDSDDELQPFGVMRQEPVAPRGGGGGGTGVVAAARSAAEQLEAAVQVAVAAASAASHGLTGSPETGAATAELESSIRDLRRIVANLSSGGGSPSPPREPPTRRAGAAGSKENERYTQERQDRQDRLQRLYAELNRTQE